MNIATKQDDKQTLNLNATDKKDDPVAVALKDAELDRIRAHLGQGMAGFARQGDIVELHKRIGEKFEQLPRELGAANQARASELRAEVETLQASLNSLEGALRIELAPMLQKSITETLQKTQPRGRGGAVAWLWAAAALCAGIGIGALYQQELFRIGAYFGL